MNFVTGAFAVAGLLAATGPIIIHLLNRRRYRIVEWAAMDFLREALQRNRRVLQLRDLILLTLRVLAVLFFALAIARPFFSSGGAEGTFRFIWLALAVAAAFAAGIWAVLAGDRNKRFTAGTVCGLAVLAAAWGAYGVAQSQAEEGGAASSRQPVHAVVLVDNSLSMAYESLEGTLLDRAKAKASEFVDSLPADSRISIIPLCSPEGTFTLDAYRTRDDARDALSRITVADRAGSVSRAVSLAAEACRDLPELSKRVVFIGDQQLSGWPAEGSRQLLEGLPELQVVQVAPETRQNLWVEDFRVQDGLADVETPANFLVTVRYSGAQRLENVQVTLTVGELTVASRTIEMEPDQTRELEFPHRIDVPAEPGRPQLVPARVEVATASVDGDRLKNDNRRLLVVPVVAGLPVVFIDSVGDREDLDAGRVGETYPLRRLLAPRTSRADSRRQLIQVRHATPAEIDIPLLEDARLVVLAGVEAIDDEAALDLLRQYVRQGGQLVIAAGGQFDPERWTDRAWRDGAGVLAAPLKAQPVGESLAELAAPEDWKRLKQFHLAFDSMQHDYFVIEGEDRQQLRDLYENVPFFKLLEADLSEASLKRFTAAEQARIVEDRAFRNAATRRLDEYGRADGSGPLTAEDEARREADQRRLRDIDPHWLVWRDDRQEGGAELAPEELARRSRPRVLARFAENGLPFIVERPIGRGRSLLFTSGVYSPWNLVARTNAHLMFDRIFRDLLEDTLPRRTFQTAETIVLPAEPGDRLEYRLTRPSGDAEQLAVEALGPDDYGVSIRDAAQSGLYTVGVHRLEEGAGDDGGVAAAKQLEIPLALNGPPGESDLTVLDEAGLGDRLAGVPVRWVERGEAIPLEGARIRGRDLWKWLAGFALLCLLAEMLVLAWPNRRVEAIGTPVSESA
ncbi:MAG: BatA domain-containing protein [Planctomycetes bacterium]|nr:BatA domain-containing protein [Planctomycetota bacterium]